MNPPPSTLEVRLASMHAGSAVSANDPLVDRARQLLDSLARYYPQESRGHLADVAVRAYQLATSARNQALFLDFLAAIDQTVTSTTAKGLPFDDVCSMVAAMLTKPTP